MKAGPLAFHSFSTVALNVYMPWDIPHEMCRTPSGHQGAPILTYSAFKLNLVGLCLSSLIQRARERA